MLRMNFSHSSAPALECIVEALPRIYMRNIAAKPLGSRTTEMLIKKPSMKSKAETTIKERNWTY